MQKCKGKLILLNLGIITLVNHVLGTSVLEDLCAADYNGDGILNVLDVGALINIILGNYEQITSADLNNDGTIDVLDVVSLINIIL